MSCYNRVKCQSDAKERVERGWMHLLGPKKLVVYGSQSDATDGSAGLTGEELIPEIRDLLRGGYTGKRTRCPFGGRDAPSGLTAMVRVRNTASPEKLPEEVASAEKKKKNRVKCPLCRILRLP